MNAQNRNIQILDFILAYDALNEPPLLHVVKEKGNRQRSAKIWLETLIIANSGTLTEKELNKAVSLIKDNQKELIASFNKVKGGKKTKTINLS